MTGRYHREHCTAIVPVRAGSRGLPGKNIRNFAGRMLYERAVEQSYQFASTCIVSTDILEILEKGPQPEYELLPRAPKLGADDTPMAQVILDVLERCNLSGTILLLQATSPLRAPEDIAAALDLYNNNTYELVMTVTETNSTPLKFGFLENGSFHPLSDPKFCFQNRQDLPAIKRPNGAAYVFNADWFRANGCFATSNIGAVEMPQYRSLDIDTISDFEAAEASYTQNLTRHMVTAKKAI